MNARAYTRCAATLGLCLSLNVGRGFPQDLKTQVDNAKRNPNQCEGLKAACAAAKADKRYTNDCEDFVRALYVQNNTFLNKAYAQLDLKQYQSASRFADLVCDYSSDISAKKQDLKQKIKVAVEAGQPKPDAPVVADRSAEKLREATQAFKNGDFDGALAAAKLVTDENLKENAGDIVQRIAEYRHYIQDAQQKENTELSGMQAARQSYQAALNISGKGPNDPAGNIRRLDGAINAKQTEVAKVTPPSPLPTTVPATPNPKTANPVGPKQAPTSLPPPNIDAQVADLLRQAVLKEAQHPGEALKQCQQAEHLLPNNEEAKTCVARLQKQIGSDPAEQGKVLAAAIRAFYGANYSDAEDGFTSYLAFPTAKYRGAASFYVGASRIYQEILEGSGKKTQDVIKSSPVQNRFKDARAACYQPVGKFVSPVVLTAWNISAANPACPK